MRVRELSADHQYLLAQAAKLLGTPVRAIQLDSDLWPIIEPHLKLELCCGLDQASPLLAIGSARRERKTVFGLELYRLAADDEAIRFVRVITPIDAVFTRPLYNFAAVPVTQFKRFYRALRRLQPRRQQQSRPVLADDDQQRLLNNTVEFLKHGRLAR